MQEMCETKGCPKKATVHSIGPIGDDARCDEHAVMAIIILTVNYEDMPVWTATTSEHKELEGKAKLNPMIALAKLLETWQEKYPEE